MSSPSSGQRPIARIGQARQGVIEVPLADLYPLHPVPRPAMPLNHIANLANSIRANGYDLSQAIPVSRMPDGRLVQLGGHHRAEAMRQLGEKTIPARITAWDDISQPAQNKFRQSFPQFPWSDFLS
jgi:hypothetical protein